MATNAQRAQENRAIYEWCRDAGHMDFVTRANMCDAYIQGQQWSEKNIRELKARRKPYITINMLLSTFATLAGEHLMRRGDVAFRPAQNGVEPTATALDKLWVNFGATNWLNRRESRVFWDGIIRGRGYYDLRMDFDDSMYGYQTVTHVPSKDILLYPDDNSDDPDDWAGVVRSRWLRASEIMEMYKVGKQDIAGLALSEETMDYADWTRDTFGHPMQERMLGGEEHFKRRILRVIERQEWEFRQTECFVDMTTGDVRVVPKAWDRERIQMAIAQHGYNIVRKRMKQVYWTVSVGDLLLHSQISPYRHLTVVPYFPFFIGGKPMGIIEHLISPQDLLNKTLSQELHIVAGIANSGYKVKAGSLANMTVEQLKREGGEDGVVIEVEGDVGNVEKMKSNQVPTGLDRLSFKAKEHIREVSLVSESMQGQDRADVSGTAIDKKTRHGSISLAAPYDALDYSRQLLARNWLSMTQQFITEPRAYNITDPGIGAQPETLEVNQEQSDGSYLNDLTVGQYDVTIIDVPSRDTYEESQFNQMMSLVKEGAPVPWSFVIRASTVENKAELMQYFQKQEGLGEPSEEARKKSELEDRKLTAEAVDKEASAEVKQAQAEKARVEAQNMALAGPDDGSDEPGMMKAQVESAVKIDTAEAELDNMEDRHDLELQKLQDEITYDRRERSLKLQILEEELARARAQTRTESQLGGVKVDAAAEGAKQKLETDKALGDAKVTQAKKPAPAPQSTPKP